MAYKESIESNVGINARFRWAKYVVKKKKNMVKCLH